MTQCRMVLTVESGRQYVGVHQDLTDEGLAQAKETLGEAVGAVGSGESAGEVSFETPSGWAVIPLSKIEAIEIETLVGFDSPT